MDIRRLIIADPSGNTTAIIFDPTPRQRMREVGAITQSAYPSVEQVVFVESKGGIVHGQMAGGEFCGNAARALGYVLAAGRDGTQTFTMSGISSPVTVNVKKDYAALTTRIYLMQEQHDFERVPVPIVHLEGISHAIMMPEHPMYSFLKRYAAQPDRWRTVTHVLEDLNILDKPASGLVFVDTDDNKIKITPYVFVRDIDTLYPEQACASGSMAVADVIGKCFPKGNSGFSIYQPSGESLKVSLKSAGDLTEVRVAGSMRIKWDGPVTNLQYSRESLLGTHGLAQKGTPLQTRATL